MLKTNDKLLIASTAIYSYLFYEQNAGINFLLFDLVLISILLIRNKLLLYRKPWLAAAGMCLFSAVGILFHSSALAIIANCVGLLLLSGFSFHLNSSAIFSFLFSCYSIATSFIYVLIDGSVRFRNNAEKENSSQKAYKAFTVFIVLLLCILFFVLYQQANPLFAENTQWVNFDFINVGWLVFTMFGFLIVYGLFYHKTIKQVEAWEQQIPFTNVAANPLKEANHKTELSAGVLLFILLNLMLVILNAGDIHTLWLKGELPKGVTHSDFVHNGISTIILSILVATALIMFLYRYNFNAIKNSAVLKLLVYGWILQNVIMLFSTACRNQIYIHEYNLTGMRIGVYVWLALAMLGLATTFLKIHKDRSNWFLLRSNVVIWFACLALSSSINWDLLITRYNIKNKPLAEVDFYYLFSLSDSNIPELLNVTKDKNFNLISGRLKNYANSSSYSYRGNTYRALMKTKIRNYLKDYQPCWQSWDLRDERIMNSLLNH